MANNTWFGATNEVLELAQFDAIPNTTAFDNPTGALSKYQRAARAYIRLAHMHLSIKAYKHFASRRIPLNIDALTANATFPLDTGINPEHIRPGTFFNVSTGTPASQNRALKNMDYRDFNTRYPNRSEIPTGSPTHWILLPIDRTNISPVHQVRIFPNPDQAYQLEYQAVLNAYPLTKSSDQILWPPEYEFALWEFAWALLERGLGEGKEGAITELAMQAVNQVRLVAGKPADVKKGFRFMRPAARPYLRRGWIVSPASVDSNGNVID